MLVDLRAVDFNAAGDGVWPNRAAAAAGTPSYAAGSFALVAGTTHPFPAVLGGVPAVVFATVGGVSSQYSASQSAFPSSGNTIWGGSDWSVEAWVYSDGSLSSGGYAPLFQWGARPGTTCDSAAVGVGASTTGGATSFYNCDAPWQSEPLPNDGTALAAGFGYRPVPLMWHHVVVTYTGTTTAPQETLTTYLDGAVNSVRSSLVLAIRKDDLRVGSWVDISANVSVSQLRVHNGALTAAQVAYNYAEFAPFAVITATGTTTPSTTPTGTPTPTSTRTNTPSGTASPSGTQVLSNSATAAATTSATPTPTSTGTIQYLGASNLLIYLAAVDFNAAAGTWDNRATSGAVSYANGDFVPDVGATSANWPTAGVAGQLGNPAVIFNVTATGAPQYLIADPALPALSGLFGNGAWTFEAWVVTPGWTAYHNTGENPVFQWGAFPSPAACGSAFFGVGSDPSYGAVRRPWESRMGAGEAQRGSDEATRYSLVARLLSLPQCTRARVTRAPPPPSQGGPYECDNAFASATFTTLASGTGGYTPLANAWTHVVVTYAGGTGPETVYVNGAVNAVTATRTLSITAASQVLLGAYNFLGTIEGGNVAVGTVRVYNAALTAAQVAFNFNELAVQYVVSPSNSPTRTQTHTGTTTPSTTKTPTSSRTTTRTGTQTATPSPSTTATAPATPTASPSASASASMTAGGTQTRTGTRSPTSTRSTTPAATSSAAATGTASPSATATAAATHSMTASVSSSSSSSPSGTMSPSASASDTAQPTHSRSASRPETHSATKSGTPSRTGSVTAAASVSMAPTGSPTASPPVKTPTVTPSAAVTVSAAATSTSTAASTPTRTPTASHTGSKTPTASLTATKTPTASKTATKSATRTKTPSKSNTPPVTKTKSGTPTKKAKRV